MAATNYTPIQLYYSTTASAAPTSGNLASGELAINITDGKLYYKDNGGVVQVLATKGAGTIGGSTTQIQYNNAGALAGNAAMTFNSGTNTTTLTTLNLTNALGATYGGTAQSAYTQGDVLYASATNTLSKLGIGTVNYILTSTGSVPQWVAPSSVTVQTANNLAGGAGGSVPYQSAADTTTFLAIGAANRVLTSSGTVPQWVTALTGLTGVSSSSITNTSLTSTRLVYSSTAGLQADSANLTFDGTTLSAAGFSTTGLSTLVKTVKIGDSGFSGTAVFAAATPAKLYIGTGTVTDTTSAIGATNAVGAVSSLAITPIAASNTSVTYTNAATLYIAGAPSAGTNITLTNPYSLYVAAGATYFGGAVTFAVTPSLGALTVTSLTDSGLTSGRVTYATTGGLLTDSANLLYSGTDLTVYGITVGRGAGAVSTNTVVGDSALSSNASGTDNTAIGYGALIPNTASGNTGIGSRALRFNTSGTFNTAVGVDTLRSNTTASENTAVGYTAGYSNTTGVQITAVGSYALRLNTTGNYNSALGSVALYSNTTGGNNTAMGYYALYLNTTASNNTAVGYQAGYSNTTAIQQTFLGTQAGYSTTTGLSNTAIGFQAFYYNTTGTQNVAVGLHALLSNTTASNNTAVGYQAGYNNSTGDVTAVGQGSLYSNTTGLYNTATGIVSLNQTTTGQHNSGFGRNAGYNNTTGSYNTALGSQSLFSGTTNLYTVAVGYQAGYNNTGSANVFVGSNAGYSNTSSIGNVFVGSGIYGVTNSAGYASTGGYNTFLGAGAGYAMTTGAKNTIIGNYGGNSGGLDIRTASGYIVLSDGDGNPRGIFDNNGSFLVGTTSFALANSNNFMVGKAFGETYTQHASGTASGVPYSSFTYNATVIGSITQSGTTAVLYNITSDQRLKENIQDAESASALIDSLQVRQFDWKTDNTHQRYGFVAQELVTVVPEAVHQPADPDEMMAVDYSKLVPMLVKEIQSLRKRLADAGIA